MANEQRPQNPPQDQDRAAPRTGVGFTVEFGDDFLRNHTINTPPFQMVVRGAFSLSRMARRERNGVKFGPREVGTAASRIPDFPGAMMAVNIRARRVRLYDPLDSKEGQELLEQYNALAKSEAGMGLPQNLGPFRAVEHELDQHQLKTLLLELARKLDSKCCRVVDGEFPSAAEIARLDGHELYDPMNSSSDKPTFKKDYQQYRDKLTAAGI